MYPYFSCTWKTLFSCTWNPFFLVHETPFFLVHETPFFLYMKPLFSCTCCTWTLFFSYTWKPFFLVHENRFFLYMKPPLFLHMKTHFCTRNSFYSCTWNPFYYCSWKQVTEKWCDVAWSIHRSQQANIIKTTPYQCRCDVTTSHRHWYAVVLTACALWEIPNFKLNELVNPY